MNTRNYYKLSACLAGVLFWSAGAFANAQDEDPLTMVVSLKNQQITVYRGTQTITSGRVSSGKKGHRTPTGIFSIMEKRRHHRSNIYRGAPMPFMQRLTWSGIALHASNSVPSRPASHGCVRLPHKFAGKLFKMDTRGAHVVIEHDPLPPEMIEHDFLFQPVAASNEAELAKQPKELSREELKELTKEERWKYKLAKRRASPDHPARIFITRRNFRDDLRDVQRILKNLEYYDGEVDALLGKGTWAGIRKFREDQGLEVTNRIDQSFLRRLYSAAGELQPPAGQILVRKRQTTVLKGSVKFEDPAKPLGSHLIHAVQFDPEKGSTRWLATSLADRYYQGRSGYYGPGVDGSTLRASTSETLSRLKITLGMRKKIERYLTRGSSIAISDNGLSHETGEQGTDFIVLTKPKLGELKQQTAKNES